MKTMEVEQKYRVKFPALLRRILRKQKARRVGRGHEHNQLWDDGSIRKQGGVLRLRVVNGRGTLTFKGPKLRSRYKRRVEIETPIEPKAATGILKAAGFRVIAQYEKYREEYALGKAHVTLDRLPGHGWFSEIEGPVSEIHKQESRLGFSKKDREERTYLEIVYGPKSIWRAK